MSPEDKCCSLDREGPECRQLGVERRLTAQGDVLQVVGERLPAGRLAARVRQYLQAYAFWLA